jgi:hypothetical protein
MSVLEDLVKKVLIGQLALEQVSFPCTRLTSPLHQVLNLLFSLIV